MKKEQKKEDKEETKEEKEASNDPTNDKEIAEATPLAAAAAGPIARTYTSAH